MKFKINLCLALFLVLIPVWVWAGPYAPKAGDAGSTAIHMNSSKFKSWATGYEGLVYGYRVTDKWKTPDLALGRAVGDSYDIVALGAGGKITMTFDPPIADGVGEDFAIFENSFDDEFLELGYVEISSNGKDFYRFSNRSLTSSPVGGFGKIDTTDITGFAGKYRQGYGTPFDLSEMAENYEEAILDGKLNLSKVAYVKILDVIGDGTFRDSEGGIIYEPYPTQQSAGFDLDAIGVINQGTSEPNVAPDQPSLSYPADGSSDTPLNVKLKINAFTDSNRGDRHLFTQWQISSTGNFDSTADLIWDTKSHLSLTELKVPDLVLDRGTTYHWRVKFYDLAGAGSNWSDSRSFTTVNSTPVVIVKKDWDKDGNQDNDVPSVEFRNLNNESIALGVKAITTGSSVEAIAPVTLDSTSDLPGEMPLGVLAFKIKVGTPGDLVRTKIYFSSPAPANAAWYKYRDGKWKKYASAEFSEDRLSVILTLEDGNNSLGDDDEIKNGVIIDPGAVVEIKSTAPVQHSSGEAGMGGLKGCFISSVQPDASDFSNRFFFKIFGILLTLAALVYLKFRAN